MTLDVYDLAYLAGGPDRVVDVALVVLVGSGRVRVHAPGELAVVEPGRQHPVEAAVMDAVGTHGHRSVDTIRWRIAGDHRLADLGRSLAAAGLLRRRLRLGRRIPGRSPWALTGPGRQALRDALEDGSSALAVALHGRPAMADADLRAAIFERPLPPVVPGGLRRRLRAAHDGDPFHPGYGVHDAAGGAASIGLLGAAGLGDGGGGGDGGG